MTITLPKELEQQLEKQFSIPSNDPLFSEYVVNFIEIHRNNMPYSKEEQKNIAEKIRIGYASGSMKELNFEEFTKKANERCAIKYAV